MRTIHTPRATLVLSDMGGVLGFDDAEPMSEWQCPTARWHNHRPYLYPDSAAVERDVAEMVRREVAE